MAELKLEEKIKKFKTLNYLGFMTEFNRWCHDELETDSNLFEDEEVNLRLYLTLCQRTVKNKENSRYKDWGNEALSSEAIESFCEKISLKDTFEMYEGDIDRFTPSVLQFLDAKILRINKKKILLTYKGYLAHSRLTNLIDRYQT